MHELAINMPPLNPRKTRRADRNPWGRRTREVRALDPVQMSDISHLMGYSTSTTYESIASVAIASWRAISVLVAKPRKAT